MFAQQDTKPDFKMYSDVEGGLGWWRDTQFATETPKFIRGGVVTYHWYRFADQPARLNADLTDREREAMQARVEKLHRNWTKDRDCLAPPRIGKLAELDPVLVVTPPKGMEAGCVCIVTRQAAKN